MLLRRYHNQKNLEEVADDEKITDDAADTIVGETAEGELKAAKTEDKKNVKKKAGK